MPLFGKEGWGLALLPLAVLFYASIIVAALEKSKGFIKYNLISIKYEIIKINHALRYHLFEVITMDEYGYRNMLLAIGLKISFYRKLRGYTQEELAERAGVSTTFIGMVEAPNLYKAPSLKTLYAIAVALDVPAYKLLQTD